MLSYPPTTRLPSGPWRASRNGPARRPRLTCCKASKLSIDCVTLEAVPMSIIQRSAAAQGDYEVVVLKDGTEHAHYDGLDVAASWC